MIGARSAAALAGVVTLALGVWWVYSWGYENGRAVSDAVLVAAKEQAQRDRNDALVRVANVNAEAVAIQADAARRIAEAQRKAPARMQVVERVTHENPDFAAVVRPDHLDRVRNEQNAELVEAANRGADLSGRIVHGLRGAHASN